MPIIDLSGKQFGKWTVLGKYVKRKAANGGVFWKCKCECNKISEVSSTSLLSGKSTQCMGCSGKDKEKRYCCRGHDTQVWGRSNSYACRACVRDKHLRTHYGMSLEDFQKLYDHQIGKCALCGKDLGEYRPGLPGWGKGSRIEVDHVHGTKLAKRQTVRGLLCGGRWSGCNRKLGKVDRLDWLKNAVRYIENPPAKEVLQ